MQKLHTSKIIILLLLTLVLVACQRDQGQITHEGKDIINWRSEWNDQVLGEAKKNHKLILLNLEASWCHWCHVMKQETYQNQEIADLINKEFIAVRVDQDTNSYLSNRYKDYGWPATIMFDSNGREIIKRAGFIEPSLMLQLLKRVVANPSPEEDYSKEIVYASSTSLDKQTKKKLEDNFWNSLDLKLGALKIGQKFIDRDSLEYALLLSKEENLDANYKKQSLQSIQVTLHNALDIMDDVWGGFYQYSTYGDWKHPHYEKLTEVQAEYLRIYSLAQLYYPSPEYLQAIKSTINYMNLFLRDKSGAYYSSQDADLKAGIKANDYYALKNLERRAQGLPRIDKTIYASKNGLMIEALAYAYKATGETRFLAQAIKAANSINKTLLVHNQQAYKHSSTDSQIYLADNLNMAKALLSLYEVTADRTWLNQAIAVGIYIFKNFQDQEHPGYLSTSKAARRANQRLDSILKPTPVLAENIKLARFFNLLKHYSGNQKFGEEALRTMQYLGSHDVAFETLSEPGILIVDIEMNKDPVHFTIVGSKRDKIASKLFKRALSYPSSYARIEWYDPQESRLLNHDVEYPKMAQAAAFSCINHACSLPIYDPEELFSL